MLLKLIFCFIALTTACSAQEQYVLNELKLDNRLQASKEVYELKIVNYPSWLNQKYKGKWEILSAVPKKDKPFVLIRYSYIERTISTLEEKTKFLVFETKGQTLSFLEYDSTLYEPLFFDGSNLILKSLTNSDVLSKKYDTNEFVASKLGVRFKTYVTTGYKCLFSPNRQTILVEMEGYIKVITKDDELMVPALSDNVAWLNDSMFVFASDIYSDPEIQDVTFIKPYTYNINQKISSELDLPKLEKIFSDCVDDGYSFLGKRFRTPIGKVDLSSKRVKYWFPNAEEKRANCAVECSKNEVYLLLDSHSLKNKLYLIKRAN
jgi:hypothetical protein